MANVRASNKKWGKIDKTGKYVINPQSDRAVWFPGSLVRIQTGRKWGWIDKTGKYVWNPTD